MARLHHLTVVVRSSGAGVEASPAAEIREIRLIATRTGMDGTSPKLYHMPNYCIEHNPKTAHPYQFSSCKPKLSLPKLM